jgi:hypothetical protein
MDFINMEKSHIISGTLDGVRSMREGHYINSRHVSDKPGQARA